MSWKRKSRDRQMDLKKRNTGTMTQPSLNEDNHAPLIDVKRLKPDREFYQREYLKLKSRQFVETDQTKLCRRVGWVFVFTPKCDVHCIQFRYPIFQVIYVTVWSTTNTKRIGEMESRELDWIYFLFFILNKSNIVIIKFQTFKLKLNTKTSIVRALTLVTVLIGE